MIAVTEGSSSRGFSHGLVALEAVVPDGLVSSYNNTHDHECVLALFDAAIAKLETT